MLRDKADVVICGAGIAGVSAAYHLAVRHGLRDIVLVDERPPLSLTSDKSTECYRNWWPGPGEAMVRLMNRSIDLLEALAEESGNVFHLNRRGYLYVTRDASSLPQVLQAAQEPARLGAGALRIHRGQADDPVYIPAAAEGYGSVPDGADLFLGDELIHRHFPYLGQAAAALHVRRAGWFSAQQLGAYMLAQARAHGVRLVDGKLSGVRSVKDRVASAALDNGSHIDCGSFVNAAGPFLRQVGAYLGADLPVYNELHMKAAVRDPLKVVPRHAPLLIWTDPQQLPWTPDERSLLAEEEGSRWLLEELPPGAHTRPEGGADSDIILLLWEYRLQVMQPTFPPPLDEGYAEVALRGLAAMLPRMSDYFEKMPRPVVDGGYYTRTAENRPLISPLPLNASYVIGALSGFGLMASCAAGELLAAHVTGSELPPYAPAFSLERYSDPRYLSLLDTWGDSGQL